ncbi:hypothetical protein J5N97_030198 [Dioscorea zingiberensis]|uniref:Uncharacterized protein n=1 Tax=Dioscorea zingiberensis TaxID=325984 RepID=A0A9D5H3U2_9LILI|nr:hypothetical protein J5N97_030198 [Dioscorea zingiberensis]
MFPSSICIIGLPFEFLDAMLPTALLFAFVSISCYIEIKAESGAKVKAAKMNLDDVAKVIILRKFYILAVIQDCVLAIRSKDILCVLWQIKDVLCFSRLRMIQQATIKMMSRSYTQEQLTAALYSKVAESSSSNGKAR